MSGARFSVGIDLGTTNSVLAYFDAAGLQGEVAPVETLEIPQLVAAGTLESPQQLPSFLYLPHPDELRSEDQVLPWEAHPIGVVGEFARQLGAKTPARLIASAKSWLSHDKVNRREAFLPLNAPEGVAPVSPVDASTKYLNHMRMAWNQRFPEFPLEQQDLVITVPASFDPGARELTLEAAGHLGLNQAVMLEEPQAAFYSWIQSSQGNWRQQVRPGEVILVVDVGGGTTDFSLIAVSEESGNLVLDRVAIGDHILLGGDNMDLALAYTVRSKLEALGRRLEPWQVQSITQACREAKEILLDASEVEEVPIVVPSRGSSLLGGLIKTSLTRAEVQQALVEGFMPHLPVTELPRSGLRSGLTSLGLPFAQDARITAHLAHFLLRQGRSVQVQGQADSTAVRGFIHPTAVLFNGGVFKSKALSERLMQVLDGWLVADGGAPARRLTGADLDRAVARGAAYYGWVRKGLGVRIRGGTAAAYYVGVESAMPSVPGFEQPIEALLIAPFGMEEGTQAEMPSQEFGIVVGEPVRFRFFESKVRRQDSVGTRLDFWEEDELQELQAIEVTLPAADDRRGEIVPVRLVASVTEVGTLRLEALSRNDGARWKVEFDVRGSHAPTSAEH